MNIDKVDNEKWMIAQAKELKIWKNSPDNGNDWNDWWMHHFDNYNFLKNRSINSILEVGCGPYAKNIEYIMGSFSSPIPSRILLSDPLLQEYIDDGKRVGKLIKHYNVDYYASSLENLEIEPVDCIVCINVLDHVYDANQCFKSMYKNLNPNGLIILGQDLTNDYDFEHCPEMVNDDIHPIKLDEEYIDSHLLQYNMIYKKIVPREEGRNPAAHYGVMLFCGERM